MTIIMHRSVSNRSALRRSEQLRKGDWQMRPSAARKKKRPKDRGTLPKRLRKLA
jgi:hypothetical protein